MLESPTPNDASPAQVHSPENEIEFIMGWYGKPIAKLKYNGIDFGFDYETGWMLPLESYKNRKPGKEPMFLRSLLPHWIGQKSNNKAANRSMVKFFTDQELFLANISIVSHVERLEELGYNHLHGRLKDFTSEDGIFNGQQSDIQMMTRSLELNMTQIAKEKRMTQLSGAQTKMSMHLCPDGNLSWESDLPSTHIIKYAGFGQDTGLVRGVAEWTGMTLARAGGLNCSDFSLIEMPGEEGLRLNYLTERFDLPTGKDDERLIFCEEVAAGMGVSYSGSDILLLNDVIDGISEVSTNKKADMLDLFKQVVANCILENADFHARNMSLLKVAAPTLDSFRSIRLSPAYDVMRTRDFVSEKILSDKREPMRLSFQCPDGDIIEFDEPTLNQFLMVGNAMGFSDEKSEKTLYDVATGMLDMALVLKENQPAVFDRHEYARAHLIETSRVVIKNIVELVPALREKLESTVKPQRTARP